MINKLLLAVATMMATMGLALAQVDVNKADVAALDPFLTNDPQLAALPRAAQLQAAAARETRP